MNFSQSRLLEQLPNQFFSNLVNQVNLQVSNGVDVINLGQGNPDKPTPDYIVEAMQIAVAKPKNHKYAQFRGQPEFKQAASEFYAEKYHIQFDAEKEVAVLGGSKIGLVELPLALMNPDDLLLLPDPGYPDYLSGAAIGQVKIETVPLKEVNNFLPDLSSIPTITAKKAKFFYINYPNNPTGAVATKKFYKELVAWAKKYEVGIISDFAYGAIGFDGKSPISFMETPGAKEVGIELYTFSKTFNMAGWRLAFAVGNPDLISAINLIQDHLFVSVFPAVQEAGIAALHNIQRDSEINKIISRYQQRRDTFLAAAAKIGWRAIKPGGTFYILMVIPDGFTSESFANIVLEKTGVVLAAANGFGEQGEGYVRIGLLVEPNRLIEAVERIGQLNLF